MELLRVREEGEEDNLINLKQVVFIKIKGKDISFNFVTGNSMSFTKHQLGDQEFEKLKNYIIKTALPSLSA